MISQVETLIEGYTDLLIILLCCFDQLLNIFFLCSKRFLSKYMQSGFHTLQRQRCLQLCDRNNKGTVSFHIL